MARVIVCYCYRNCTNKMDLNVVFNQDVDSKIYAYFFSDTDDDWLAEDENEFSFLHITTYTDSLAGVAFFLKLHSLTRVSNAVDATTIDMPKYELRFQLLY